MITVNLSIKIHIAILLSLIIFPCSSISACSLQDMCKELAIVGFDLDLSSINKLDDSGVKQGQWIEKEGDFIFISSYSSGIKNGIEKIYYKGDRMMRLYSISVFNNNELQTEIRFHDNGMPVSVIYDIIKVDSSICYPENWSEGYIFPYLGYTQDFDETDGNLTAEGYMIFGEDMEMDCERVGRWKIFTQDGNIEIKDYGGFKTDGSRKLINLQKAHNLSEPQCHGN